MAKALEILGYNVCRRISTLESQMNGESVMSALESNELEPIFAVAKHYNAFADNPWSILYQEVDNQFPGSKFILSIRDEEEWLKSAVNYFQGYETEIRRFVYGAASPLGNEELYLEKYRKHNKAVLEYFKNRPQDLLLIDIEKDLNWNKLCSFLGKSIPSVSFPHENKARLKELGELKPINKKTLSIKRLKGFIALQSTQRNLFIEAYFWLFISRVLIIFFSFKSIAKLIGNSMETSPEILEKDKLLSAQKTGRVIKKACLYTPFRSLCFEQALTVKFMLNRRNISSTIYFGVAKDSPENLRAHAWTRAGNYYVTGNKGKELFTEIASFA